MELWPNHSQSHGLLVCGCCLDAAVARKERRTETHGIFMGTSSMEVYSWNFSISLSGGFQGGW